MHIICALARQGYVTPTIILVGDMVPTVTRSDANHIDSSRDVFTVSNLKAHSPRSSAVRAFSGG